MLRRYPFIVTALEVLVVVSLLAATAVGVGDFLNARVNAQAPPAPLPLSAPKTMVQPASPAIEADRKARVDAATAEVSKVLEKYHCALSGVTYIEGNQVVQTVRVVAINN